jgi:REP element-mobilizing transposase RayT
MNRGLARRTVFETRQDVRAFLARLALSVRRGELEVHAYCVLTTHYHLLVRSRGGLSEGMRRIQNDYVRWFNRGRRRDGPLFRGRFRSKHVRSLVYRTLLVRYIDANPVQAGLVRAAWDYPHGSARHYMQPSRPPWLARSWVEDCVRSISRSSNYDPGCYRKAFGPSLTHGQAALVEHRLNAKHGGDDRLDDLLRASSDRFRARMQWKALLADGGDLGLAVCDGKSVERVIEEGRSMSGEWSVPSSRKSSDGWTVARVALLRELCRFSLPEIARQTGLSTSGVEKMLARHRRLFRTDEDFANRLVELAERSLDLCGLASDSAPVLARIVEEVS